MKFLFDFLPVVLFFVAYKFYGIYVATSVAIAASVLQVGLFWFKYRRFETMHLVTLAIIGVFGTLTLVLHDPTFIKWKPTVLNWAFALAFLGSEFMGAKNIPERMMGANVSMPAAAWTRLNLSWVTFFILVGCANIYVAFYYAPDLDAKAREEIWVNFKLIGMLGLTFLFAIGQAIFLSRYMKQAGESDADNEK